MFCAYDGLVAMQAAGVSKKALMVGSKRDWLCVRSFSLMGDLQVRELCKTNNSNSNSNSNNTSNNTSNSNSKKQ